MKRYLLVACLFVFTSFIKTTEKHFQEDSKFLSYTVNPVKSNLKFYWKDSKGENYQNFENLKTELKENGKELVFAMNGGMYKQDLSPLGLYVEGGIVKTKLNTVKEAYGNFYLQPNGVFLITASNKPIICTTENYNPKLYKVKYATQSGPMLIIDGSIHPKFNKDSQNVNIRNGVGILPNGELLFAMSKEKVNLYTFADYFKSKDCKNALYLDGFVSKTYLPSKDWEQLDGTFGVIIAVTKDTP